MLASPVRMTLTLLAACALSSAASHQQETAMPSPEQARGRRAADPPAAARMLKIVHGWPGTPEEQDRLVASLKSQGYGGVVTNIQFGGGYVEADGNWPPLVGGLDRLRRAGMVAWLYDEEGYPSGRAGTIVLRDHPELEARGLLVAQAEAGPGPVSLALPAGKPLFAAAFPVSAGAIDLKGRVELSPADGRLEWTAPAGRWRVIAGVVGPLYDGTQVACSGYPEKSPYVDLLHAGTGKAFIEVTHDRYAARLGADLSKRFIATFTDEPSTMAIYFNKMPWAVLPWTDDMPQEFRARRGYDLLPLLPCLAAEAGDVGRRARYDFYRTVSELMVDRWWEPLRRWCKEHRIESGGHALLEENILHHVPLYGDLFTAFRHMDSTGIDCLSSDPSVPRYRSMAGMGADVPWNAARLASSAAELDGKPHVMCEVSEHIQNMARPRILLKPEQYRGTWNRLLLGGINVLTSYHAFPGWADAQVREANDYIGRCVAAISGGRRVAEVAVLYPVESVWTRFTPSELWVEQASPECRQIEVILRDLSEELYRSRREFDYIDSRTLVEGKVAGGRLTYRDHAWRAIVLPGADTLPEAAWRKLQAFQKSGGTVVFIGAQPRNSDRQFPSPLAQRVGAAMFAGERPARRVEAGEAARVPGLLDAVLPPDLRVEGADPPVRMTRRRIGGRDVYFVINDSPTPWSGTVTVASHGPVEAMDPANGELTRHSGADVRLQLAPYGATVLSAGPSVEPGR